MTVPRFVFSVSLLAALALLPHDSETQIPATPTQEDILSRPVTVPDQPEAAYSVALSAIQSAGAPGGVISHRKGCSAQQGPLVHPRGNTLRRSLDSIVQDDPSYTWTFADGVINLLPSNELPPLLRTHLETYDSGGITNAISAVTLLVGSKEIYSAATKLGLQMNPSGSGLGGVAPGTSLAEKPLGIHLQNVTLLEAMNAIARANTHGVWSYYETQCGSVHQFDLLFTQ